MKDWPRQIGDQHGARDRAVGRGARVLADREREQHAACLRRWPAIVTAMRTLVVSYNEGAGLEAVTLIENPVNPGVTLESTINRRRAMVIALDGSDVSVRTRNGQHSPMTGMYWVSLNRTDENAAAYLLRDWLERL